MDNGRAVATGTKEQLKSMINTGEKITVELYQLKNENLQEIKHIKGVTQADFSENMLIVHFIKGRHNLINLLGYLQDKDISFGRVYSESPTLNDVFLEITGKQLRD